MTFNGIAAKNFAYKYGSGCTPKIRSNLAFIEEACYLKRTLCFFICENFKNIQSQLQWTSVSEDYWLQSSLHSRMTGKLQILINKYSTSLSLERSWNTWSFLVNLTFWFLSLWIFCLTAPAPSTTISSTNTANTWKTTVLRVLLSMAGLVRAWHWPSMNVRESLKNGSRLERNTVSRCSWCWAEQRLPKCTIWPSTLRRSRWMPFSSIHNTSTRSTWLKRIWSSKLMNEWSLIN